MFATPVIVTGAHAMNVLPTTAVAASSHIARRWIDRVPRADFGDGRVAVATRGVAVTAGVGRRGGATARRSLADDRPPFALDTRAGSSWARSVAGLSDANCNSGSLASGDAGK
jgi:hypothetical protein